MKDNDMAASLVVKVDFHEGKGPVCVSCFRKIAEESDFPNLLLSVSKVSITMGGNASCPECNRKFPRFKAEEDALYLLQMGRNDF